ncbi:MAG: hypothetical protein L3J37_05375 [Rhodobacteraceae bacterium]|nr:hypothetical protein [Paracoccaceae bacterium]
MTKDKQSEATSVEENPAHEVSTVETSEVEHHEPEAEELHGEEHHVSFAARSLQILALLMAGVVFGLWAGPRLAPHLPEGMAPVAAWLSPQTNASIETLDALRAETDRRLLLLESGIKREEIETRLANFQTDIVNPLRNQMSNLSDQVAATDNTAIEDRLWAVEGKVVGLVAELESLGAMMGNLTETGGSISADTAASIAAYRTKIDSLQAQVDEITAWQGELSRAVSQVVTSASQQMEEARQLAEGANETALVTQNRLAISAALGDVEATLQTGNGFSAALDALSELSGTPTPDALKIAAGGVSTLEALEQSFPVAAHDAIRADIAAQQSEGGLAGIGLFLRAQVATRSLSPQEGDSADAILSRMEAALKTTDLATAAREAESLPEAAAAEMADWLTQLKARAAALEAFNTWRTALEAGEQ